MDEHKSHPTGISSTTTKVKMEGVALCVHPMFRVWRPNIPGSHKSRVALCLRQK
jgi:hypothetical protein